MDKISTLIEFFEDAGIRYEVDQSININGESSTIDVYVYDENDSSAIFSFDAHSESLLTDFRITQK